MPRVPEYSNFQTQESVTPNVQFQAPSGPTAGAIAAEQQGQMGRAMQVAGGELHKIAMDAAEQANQVRINDAVNSAVQAKLKLTYDQKDGFIGLKGKDAIERPDGKPLDQEYSEKLQTQFEQIKSGLANTAQKQAFDFHAGQILSQFQHGVGAHMAREYAVHRNSVADGTVSINLQQMSLPGADGQTIAMSVNAIKGAVNDKFRGLAATDIEARIIDAVSPGHVAVIANAVDSGNMQGARNYLESVTAELTPRAREAATKLLESGDFERRTQDKADEVYARFGSDMPGALAEVRKTMNGKEEDAVVTRLKTLDAERVGMRERAQRDAADIAWKTYANSGGLSKIPPSVLASMDGKDLDSLRRTAKADAQAKIDRTEVKTDPNVYYALSVAAAQDPKFKAEDLRRYFDKLNPSDRKHFIDLQSKVIKPDSEDQVVGVGEQKSAVIKSLGLRDKEAGVFHMVADKALFSEQQDKGRKLNQEERQKVLDRLVIQGDVQGRWTDTHLYSAIAEGREASFKATWSDDDKRKAKAALIRQGINTPTDEQISATLRAVYKVK